MYDVLYYNSNQKTAIISKEPILHITINYGDDFYASFPLKQTSPNLFETKMTQKIDLSGFLEKIYADETCIDVHGFDIFYVYN
jgi:hypothetical protein